jgi:quercetin dioxygenase-like cupin family protein
MGDAEVRFKPSGTYSETEESEPVKVTDALFFRLPKGKSQSWHNAAKRQYVVALRGRGEVELGSGQRVALKPGDVVLTEDLTGKGHVTRSTGSEDLLFFVVPIAGP